jgi:hypothetical protein
MLIITGTIVFLGKLSLHQALVLLLADYVVRVIFVLIVSAPSAYFVSYIKKTEGLDAYDYQTKFNPFKLDTI